VGRPRLSQAQSFSQCSRCHKAPLQQGLGLESSCSLSTLYKSDLWFYVPSSPEDRSLIYHLCPEGCQCRCRTFLSLTLYMPGTGEI
jgi:hypothetical protein